MDNPVSLSFPQIADGCVAAAERPPAPPLPSFLPSAGMRKQTPESNTAAEWIDGPEQREGRMTISNLIEKDCPLKIASLLLGLRRSKQK